MSKRTCGAECTPWASSRVGESDRLSCSYRLLDYPPAKDAHPVNNLLPCPQVYEGAAYGRTQQVKKEETFGLCLPLGYHKRRYQEQWQLLCVHCSL